MDERQKEAAERALHRVEMDELMKRIALRHRIDCINDVSFYGLPYRLLYDLEQSPEQVPLNHFYPRRACSSETKKRAWEAVQAARDSRGELTDEEVQKIRENIESADFTPEADREQLFTCFLEGWDFSTFKNWDWTGNKIPAEEADRLRACYTERQKQYQDHPERFSPPALKADDDMSRYDRHTKYMLRMLDDIREQEDIDYWTEQEGEFFRNESKFIGKQKGE